MKKFKITHRFPDIEEVENKLKEITNSQFEFEIIKELVDEETFSKILTAIDQATQLNSEYWSQNQKQIEGNSDILEADIVEG